MGSSRSLEAQTRRQGVEGTREAGVRVRVRILLPDRGFSIVRDRVRVEDRL